MCILHKELKSLNLSAIGVAPAHDLDDEYARLLDWMSHGYHGNMAWLAKSARKRCDPAHVMAEPKSVIVCAMRYEDMPKKNPPSPPFSKGGIIPKYLLHEDYHIIMMEKLETVAQAIKAEYPDMRYKCYVDTGPVLEKAWGARAGIGFIGKNTLLISPEHGSQLALGVVVTSVSLRLSAGCLAEGAGGDEAIPRKQLNSGDCHAPFHGARNDSATCGTCTACIDACPTKALISPYILDARKCISYKFFIEKQINGCDVCQDVCPFNKCLSA